MQAATGNIAYAVLASDGFLGLGDKMVAIPWRALRQSAAAKTFRLAMTDQQLKKARLLTETAVCAHEKGVFIRRQISFPMHTGPS